MGKNRLNQGHGVPIFVDKFGTALDSFSLKVRETANIKHTGSTGTEREGKLAEFINELLPDNYKASSGEAVDLYKTRSPQMDVMIYDSQKNFPFYSGPSGVILPAEALLASVEVKSRLTNREINRSQKSAENLKSLKPYKKPLKSQVGGEKCRYLHSLFAYETNLGSKDWAKKELQRFDDSISANSTSAIDLVYVLKMGLINIKDRKVILEDDVTGQALVSFQFAIYNFIARENVRREAAPYFNYVTDLNKYWQHI